MTARTRNLGSVVIVCLGLATMIILYPKNGRQETNQQGQPAVEKLYGIYCSEPNQTVIDVKGVRTVIDVKGVRPEYTRQAIEDIKKNYNVERVIDLSILTDYDYYTKVVIIATPKEPNASIP